MDSNQNIVPITDEDIVEGLRQRNPRITLDYFYGYCRIAYYIYDRQYILQQKPGMDFYSIAHEYYLSLEKHDFKQLEDRKPGMSLKTWMVNGFRFVLLDKLKAYKKEFRSQSFEERVEKSHLRFDVADDNFSQDLRDTVYEICHEVLGRDSRSSLILQMMLIDGFKGKEVAEQLHLTPSAITQRYHKLLKETVMPYFKRYYEAPSTGTVYCDMEMPAPSCEAPISHGTVYCDMEMPELLATPRTDSHYYISPNYMQPDYSHRITPDNIQTLQPNQIFVFGSNLAGMHGGGAARAAHLYFGAVLGNGDGPQGQSYAIPTMQGGVETIRPYVDKFIEYAAAHPQQTFLVTPIGCGIAGFVAEDIAPLFSSAVSVENIHLPKSFWKILL